jgi:hypothetical protein
MIMNKNAIARLEKLLGITLDDREVTLLTTQNSVLGPLDSQRAFLLTMALTPVPCPACQQPVSRRSADPDWDVNGSTPDDRYVCPRCGAKLTWHLSLTGDQSFTLNPGQAVTTPPAKP